MKSDFWSGIGVLAIFGFILALLVVVISCGTVDAGERGVLLRFGEATGEVKQPGIYFAPRGIFSVVTMDVRTQAYQTEAAAASLDLQDVSSTVTLNYAIEPASVVAIYTTLGRDYQDRIISPTIQESMKATTATFTAEQLITLRPRVAEAVFQAVKQRLQPYGIRAERLSIVSFDFSASFNASIEAKVSAAQKVLEAENNLRRIEVEALQAVAVARGQANADIERARGVAQANEIIGNSLKNNEAYLLYLWIQELSDNHNNVIYVPTEGGIPILEAGRGLTTKAAE